MNYAKYLNIGNLAVTDQAKSNQIKTESGGYAFKVDDWKRLERFLILGSEGGSYYVSEKKLTIDNARVVERCVKENGIRAIQEIAEVSVQGKAPKNDAAIFALAIACCADDVKTRNYAFSFIPDICRTGTHILQFVQAIKELRGFGKGLRNGIANWYNKKTVDQLAFQIAKYGQRNGISHRDVLRLIHIDAVDDEHNAVYRYITCGLDQGGSERQVYNKKSGKTHEYPEAGFLPDFIHAFEELKKADEKRTIKLIEEYGFTHEMIDTRHKNSAVVWEALLQKMPLHATIRNLNKMTAIGLVAPLSQGTKLIVQRLGDEDKIKNSRLHPLTILGAQRQYSKGHGDKGSLTWTPVPQIVSALEGAFYKSFDYVEPSGKNHLIALDVSGSMSSEIHGTGMSSCEVGACIAMVVAKTEPNYHVFGFAHQFVNLGIHDKMSLAQAAQAAQKNNFGSTDCSLAFRYAINNKLDVDAFVTITDSDVNTGRHPFTVLNEYRKKMNKPNAKSIVMATYANALTIADPNDYNSLDICGFSTDVPQVISAFVKD